MTGAPADYSDHLKAIVAAPEDDAPRLALADFVRPSEPELATFIALQLASAQRDRRRRHLPGLREPTAEERRLLARNVDAWTRLVAPYVRHTADGAPACTFYRGLVAHAVVEASAFLEHADWLLAVAPIRHLDFHFDPAARGPAALARILASPALARLDSVGFPGAGLGDAEVAAIAACPHLAGCLYLELSRNPLGPPAFEAIARSPHLRRLLVVERAQLEGLDPAQVWHPGEVVVARITAERSRATLQEIRPEGRALEAAHGYLPWLHLDNRVARLDAGWAAAQGQVPVRPAGAPVSP